MTKSINTKTRNILGLAVAATLGATALPATAMDAGNLKRSVPNWISVDTFNSMSQNELYKVDLAQERGQRVVIEGYSLSQSREVVDDALANDQEVSRAANTTFGDMSMTSVGKGKEHPVSTRDDVRR
ncbi:hypothetical protein [uncultured Roseovarius sp.]|uniref:hypothetical protein n=1 Tax=uncultured Roseovarius sp. TaxID=293344 RepID=UPI0025DC0E64|nr:hypothetical protein [uncultured Roseovarius sp.]